MRKNKPSPNSNLIGMLDALILAARDQDFSDTVLEGINMLSFQTIMNETIKRLKEKEKEE